MSTKQQSQRLIIMAQLLKLHEHDVRWLTIPEFLPEFLAEVLLKSLLNINFVALIQDLLIIFVLPFIITKVLIIIFIPQFIKKIVIITLLIISLFIKLLMVTLIKANFLLAFLIFSFLQLINFHYWVLLTF